jgi:hypothetical protein
VGLLFSHSGAGRIGIAEEGSSDSEEEDKQTGRAQTFSSP